MVPVAGVDELLVTKRVDEVVIGIDAVVVADVVVDVLVNVRVVVEVLTK